MLHVEHDLHLRLQEINEELRTLTNQRFTTVVKFISNLAIACKLRRERQEIINILNYDYCTA